MVNLITFYHFINKSHDPRGSNSILDRVSHDSRANQQTISDPPFPIIIPPHNVDNLLFSLVNSTAITLEAKNSKRIGHVAVFSSGERGEFEISDGKEKSPEHVASSKYTNNWNRIREIYTHGPVQSLWFLWKIISITKIRI